MGNFTCGKCKGVFTSIMYHEVYIKQVCPEFVNENVSVVKVRKHLDICSDCQNTYLCIQGKDHLNVLIVQKLSLVQAIHKDSTKFIQIGNCYSIVCAVTSIHKSYCGLEAEKYILLHKSLFLYKKYKNLSDWDICLIAPQEETSCPSRSVLPWNFKKLRFPPF